MAKPPLSKGFLLIEVRQYKKLLITIPRHESIKTALEYPKTYIKLFLKTKPVLSN